MKEAPLVLDLNLRLSVPLAHNPNVSVEALPDLFLIWMCHLILILRMIKEEGTNRPKIRSINNLGITCFKCRERPVRRIHIFWNNTHLSLFWNNTNFQNSYVDILIQFFIHFQLIFAFNLCGISLTFLGIYKHISIM